MSKFYFLLIFLGFLFASCNTQESPPDNLNLPPNTHVRHEINFLNGNIPLPKKYKELSYVQLENELVKIIQDPDDMIGYYSFAENLEDNGDYILFADTTQYSNFIVISLEKYIDFGNYASAIFFRELENQVFKTYQETDISVTRLQHSFFKVNGSKIIKVRYQIGEMYFNQYLITSRNRTFIFAAWNNDILAFDTEIKGMRLK